MALASCHKGKFVAHEGLRGSGGLAPVVLSSTVDGGEWSVSYTPRPHNLLPRESASGIHWIEGWVGSGTGLNALEKR
jgi:hypothetical protein